jgi:hypothetical protein
MVLSLKAVLEGIDKSRQYHRAPVLDIEFSSNAARLPECVHLIFGSKRALARLCDRDALVARHDVNARAPRFDFTRDLGELLLILLRPGARFPKQR